MKITVRNTDGRLGTGVSAIEYATQKDGAVSRTVRAAPVPVKKTLSQPSADSSLTKGAGTAAAAQAEGLPSARPSAASLQNQLRQAQVDLDTDAIIRLNKQLKEERARNPSSGGYSLGQGLADIVKKGANQVAQAGADTLAFAEDIVNAPFELFSGMELGSLRKSGEGIFNPLREKVKAEGTALAEKSAENVSKGGKAAAALDKYGTATVAAVPQAVIAMLTGGTSAAAQTAGGVARTAAAEMSPGVARTIQNAVAGLAKNPQFWSSFSQVVGSGYEQALEDGASVPKAALYAVGNGLMNAAVEVGGGIQTLPGELQAGASGWRALVDSALDEGKEEVIQGVIERAMQNLVYQKGNPLASLKDQDAVFNPLTSLEEFAGGAVVGGILSGGQMGLTNLAQYQTGKTLSQPKEAAQGTAQNAQAAGQGQNTPATESAVKAAQTAPRDVVMEAVARGGRLGPEVDMQEELERFQLKDAKEAGTDWYNDAETRARIARDFPELDKLLFKKEAAPETGAAAANDGLGAADAGSLNSDYDRLQAESSRFHPEGENAARPVDVPMQDFEGRNISRTASTVMGAKSIPNDVIPMIEQMVAGGRLSYDKVTDSASLERSRSKIETDGFDGALEAFRRDVQNGISSKDVTTLGELLLVNAANAKNENAVAEILSLYTALGTNTAQAMQARSILRKLSPEAQLYSAQRAVDRINKGAAERQRAVKGVRADDALAAYQTVVDVMRQAFEDAANAEQTSTGWVETLGQELAANAARRARPSKQGNPTAYEIMLRDLNTLMSEHVRKPEGTKFKRTASEIIANALANRQEYAAAWQTAQAELIEKYAGNPAMLEALKEFNETSPLFGGAGPDTTMMKAVAEAALENDVDLKNMVIRSQYDAENLTSQLTDTLIQRTGANTDADRAVLREAVQRYVRRKTEGAGKYAFEYIGGDIQRAIREIGTKMSEIIKSGPGSKAATLEQITNMLTEEYGVSGEAAKAIAADIAQDFENTVREQSRKRLESMFKDRPARTQRTMRSKFEELVNLGAFSGNEFNQQAVKRLFGVETDAAISPELIGKFLEQTDQAGRDAVMEEILQDVADQLPGSWRGIFDSIRHLSMLFNPKTHGRNILGNAAFQIPVTGKNRVGAALELAAKSAGADIERTKSLSGANPFGALAKEARADWANVKDFLEGGKYDENKSTSGDIRAKASPFKNVKRAQWAATLLEKTLGRLSELNMEALSKEDEVFKKFIYAQSLAGYLQANGVDSISKAAPDLLSRARNYAAQEALRNTFNDRNQVSDAVASLGRLKNNPNRVLSGLSYFTEGVLPYKRTPANVGVRSVEYSPVGGAAEILKFIYRGATGQETAESVSRGIDRLSAGVSGSVLFAFGWLLAAAGYLRGGGDKDKDQRNFDNLTGHQNYALELDNGTSVTLDWAAPDAVPLFMGVEANKAFEDGKLTTEEAVSLLKNMSEPMIQMSFLQGVNNMFESAAYAKNRDESVIAALAAQAATGYLTQAVPTIGGQFERTAENKRMTTYTDENSVLPKDLQYTLGKLSQKVPGWDYQQIPYLDAWGREEETGDPLTRTFNNFFNPAYVSQVTVDQVERELQRVKDATGISSVFPDRAPRYFTVDKERKNLTAEEYQKYAQKRGQLSAETLKQVMDSPGYKNLSDEKKAEAISDVYQYADAMGKMEVSSYKPGDDTIAAGALKSMLPPSIYILYRLNRDRDGNGNITARESAETLMELPDLSDAQRGDAWGAMNKQTSPFKNPFTGTLAKEGMTPEESMTAWGIYGGSGTKEEPYTQRQKKQDMQKELDLTAAEVNRLWILMENAAEGK